MDILNKTTIILPALVIQKMYGVDDEIFCSS